MRPVKIKYKQSGVYSLHLHVFEPDRNKYSGNRPAMLYFFGGGFVNGSPEQFYPHCQHFARNGFVAVSVEYRVKSLHGTSPFDSVEDGISAMRWLRSHTHELSIDPSRIVAAGGSAGGHVVLSSTLFGEASEMPNAWILFNPVVDTTATGYKIGLPLFEGRERERSPVHHVRSGLPPTLIFHGTADEVSPYESVERFQQEMLAQGNTCQMVTFEGRGHGFFNLGRPNTSIEDYEATLHEAEQFLKSLHYPFD
ncbi:alpha/beta hydrolase [Paenibacillus chungangensis]|uniref:Alpha/beta hydrolase n=1 Tax=Paenibacillus chungangensis TaxID=696535 RepID=A0ABW3HKL3_9BACL